MKSNLEQELDNFEIKLESKHLYFDTETNSDKYIVIISYQNTNINIDYSMGVGHRTIPKMHYGVWSYEEVKRSFSKKNSKSEFFKFTKPGVVQLADVIYCLISDYSANEQSFKNWAGDFGYDSDSIKALDTYKKCQENGDKIVRILGTALIEKLRHLEH